MEELNQNICYNCQEILKIDFYWIVINKENPDDQWLGEDVNPKIWNDEKYEWVEFEICGCCGAAI